MLRIDKIKLPVPEKDRALNEAIERILQLDKISKGNESPDYSFRILRRSLDARKKPELFYVYSVVVTIDPVLEERILKHARASSVSKYEPKLYKIPDPTGDILLKGRPVIVGSGPAGLFCAYILCSKGYAPLILERGESVELRTETVRKFWNGETINVDSNVQFGEGGAGTFSDGKLNTGVNDKNGRNQFVLDTFVKMGADEETAYINKPHLGTDVLVRIVKELRCYITEHGGTFKFNTRMTGFETDGNEITAVIAEKLSNNGFGGSNNTSEQIRIETNCLVMAIGHSARDTFKMLYDKGVQMAQKNFAVGLRIQHPQDMIDDCQYGKDHDENLPVADYKLSHHTNNGRDVYSFCMCPGGFVVNASSEKGRVAVNGMSYSLRDSGTANSAIIVSVDKKDFGSYDPLAGMEFQRKLEERAYTLGRGRIPIQQYGDFKNGEMSGKPGDFVPRIKGSYTVTDLRKLLPEELNEAIIESIDKFGYTIDGFDRPDAVLAGVESRSSSPVRILRNEDFMSNITGMYPCGEGAGYAGGITSASMDGIKVAEKIMARYTPVKSFHMSMGR
ncbi:MAG: FAD-dependent monooxygenase [Lachnospiraceae bacterium]|nr:FAD-dependent monooxygenase [Lachnospiraceae bacterium]